MTATRPVQRLIVLGSTGSIGVSTLEVVSHFAAMQSADNVPRFEIVGLAAGKNANELVTQKQNNNKKKHTLQSGNTALEVHRVDERNSYAGL